MVIAVLLAHEYELFAVPRQEGDGCLRLDILVVSFAIQFGDGFAGSGIVAHESAVVLVAVEFKHIYDIADRIPGYIGKVAVGGVAGFEIERVARDNAVHPNADNVRGLPSHRVFLGCRLGDIFCGVGGFRYINQWIVGHHTLVHSIESEACAGGIPE